MLDRREVLLHGLDRARSVGAEIGPLDRPLVAKAEATVFYVDYCDTGALRRRWCSDPGVKTDHIHADVVWGGNSLREALATATPGKLDFVIASHVIEHVPDLIGWLREVEDVLARDAEENQTHHDVHCWVFTPASFAELTAVACGHGLVSFACKRFVTTQENTFEFFVELVPCPQAGHAAASWGQTPGMHAAASTDTH